MWKTTVANVQKSLNFLGEEWPRTPYFIMHQKVILPYQNGGWCGGGGGGGIAIKLGYKEGIYISWNQDTNCE